SPAGTARPPVALRGRRAEMASAPPGSPGLAQPALPAPARKSACPPARARQARGSRPGPRRRRRAPSAPAPARADVAKHVSSTAPWDDRQPHAGNGAQRDIGHASFSNAATPLTRRLVLWPPPGKTEAFRAYDVQGVIQQEERRHGTQAGGQ